MVFAGGHYAQVDAHHEHYASSPTVGLPTVLLNAAIDGLGFPSGRLRRRASRSNRRWAISFTRPSKIGLVLGPADHVPSSRKLAAARRSRTASGSPFDELARRALALLARDRPGRRRAAAPSAGITGIVCASDPMALGAIRAARRAGKRVPADVSVIGFDDSALMNCTDPPLTTVRQPIEPMGRMVIELLVGQINGSAVPQDELLFEPELVVRGSTGPVSVA